ncbi:MAG TPA: SAM-dependent methyltransferase [Lacipirellulaceae bacterium]
MANGARHFVFMTCRPGAEDALKREVARSEPAWRLAFSRPGFVTFKLPVEQLADERKLAERHWTFAHAQGVSLGQLMGTQLGTLAEQVWNQHEINSLADMAHLADVHVWEPSATRGPNEISEADEAPLCLEIETAVRTAAPETVSRLRREPSGRPRPSPRNALVLDIALIEPGQWWVGYHRAVSWPARWPGGAIPVKLPDHAVSRAYAKMEEAIQWSDLPLAAGDECVEIGCAPGGASQALLDRGLLVTGIDPADIDPAVLEHPRFRHLKKRGKDVRRHEFFGVRWLAADMNIAPSATLDDIEPIVTHPGVTIRGMIVTLKLAEWSVAERLPEFVQRVRSWGFRDVRVRQLVTGGQEVCLAALRRKALRRIGRAASRRRPSGTGLRRDLGHKRPSGPHF